jgi:N-methylhydantoinase A
VNKESQVLPDTALGAEGGLRYRFGIDIGGTFTDIVLLGDDGSVRTRKISSTPDDYGQGIVAGITALMEEFAVDPTSVDGVVHATTVATNTILEHKGARTALITTEGFRDVLEMRRLRIPVLYDLQYDKPAPLVPRRRRYEIGERMGPRGDVRRELDETEAEQLMMALQDSGVEALAICLLHSYANPDHERRIAAVARRILGDRVFITFSADILPEIREYERTSTTVVNAYVGPTVRRYMGALTDRLRAVGITAPLQIMQSNGGIMTAAAAIRKPAAIVESGPAAGVIAAAQMARKAGHGKLISLDMGGTTAKAAIIENGKPTKTSEYEVGAGINLSSKLVQGGGYPIKLPFVDVSEIGAGGGSIVAVDGSGLIKVGPMSAGAEPGPACYGIGGEEPTLTDALVVLGYLNADYLVGGSLPLDAAKARQVMEERVALPLGKPVIEAAYGVFVIAAATMTRAVKAVSTYRGRDPRDFVLFAFGGNGPVAAVGIARALQMERVLVPPAPGVFSAFGLLFSDIEHEFVQAFFTRRKDMSAASIEQAYRKLEAEARRALLSEGYASERVSLTRYADMRYSGQAYELTIPVADGALDMDRMISDFGDEHLQTYGHRSDADPVDMISVKILARATVRGPREYDPSVVTGGNGTTEGERAESERMVYFGDGLVPTPVVSRESLRGRTWEGPLIVEEYDSTCVIPPGARATLDDHANIDIAVGSDP